MKIILTILLLALYSSVHASVADLENNLFEIYDRDTRSLVRKNYGDEIANRLILVKSTVSNLHDEEMFRSRVFVFIDPLSEEKTGINESENEAGYSLKLKLQRIKKENLGKVFRYKKYTVVPYMSEFQKGFGGVKEVSDGVYYSHDRIQP